MSSVLQHGWLGDRKGHKITLWQPFVDLWFTINQCKKNLKKLLYKLVGYEVPASSPIVCETARIDGSTIWRLFK